MSDPAARGPLGDVDPLALVRAAWRRWWRWVLLSLAVLAVLAGVLGPGAQWGDVATWVVAVMSLLAFVAAVFAGLVGYEVLRVEMRRVRAADTEREHADELRRQAQASQVAAWYATWESELFGPERPLRLLTHGALIRNASGLPVYDVRVSFSVAPPAESNLEWVRGVRFSSPALVDIVPPGELRVEIPDDVRELEEAGGNKPRWLVAVEFTDAAGTQWLRDARGRLSQDGSPGVPGLTLQR